MLEKANFVIALLALSLSIFAIVEVYLLDRSTHRRMERFIALMNAVFDLIEARRIAERQIIEALREEKRPCN